MQVPKSSSSESPSSDLALCLKTTAKIPEFADVFFPHITSLEQTVQEALLPDPLGYYAEKGIGEYCALYYADALGWVLTSFMEWQYQCEVERKNQWEEVKRELDSLFTVWRESSVEESLKRKILLAYLNGRFHIPLNKWFTIVYQKWKESKNV